MDQSIPSEYWPASGLLWEIFCLLGHGSGKSAGGNVGSNSIISGLRVILTLRSDGFRLSDTVFVGSADNDCSRAKCIDINRAEVGVSVAHSPYLTGARMAQRSCLSLFMIGTACIREKTSRNVNNTPWCSRTLLLW